MLLVLISFVALRNISYQGHRNQALTFELILGMAIPLWPASDTWSGGSADALGTKLVLNEVIAYVQFSASAELFRALANDYALCTLWIRKLRQPGYFAGRLICVGSRAQKRIFGDSAEVRHVCGTLVNLITGAIVGLVYLI